LPWLLLFKGRDIGLEKVAAEKREMVLLDRGFGELYPFELRFSDGVD
jgi:hypothetical protein